MKITIRALSKGLESISYEFIYKIRVLAALKKLVELKEIFQKVIFKAK